MVSRDSRGVYVSAIVVLCVLVSLALLRPTDACRTNLGPQGRRRRGAAEDRATHRSRPRRGAGRQADRGDEDPCLDLDQRAIVQAQPGLRVRRRGAGGGGIAAHSLYSPPLGEQARLTCRFSPIGNRRKSRPTRMRFPSEFTFHLPKGTTIGGVVKNEDGQPIAGAKVGVMCHGGRRPRRARARLRWLGRWRRRACYRRSGTLDAR